MKLAFDQVVAKPLGSVGENAHVPTRGLFSSFLDVSCELIESFNLHFAPTEIAFHLNNG